MNEVNTDLECATVFSMSEYEGTSTGGGATINAVDIARLAGVGRAAVSNWRKRYDDFPEPVAGTASSPLFDAGKVRRWLQNQGKLKELPLGEELWRALDALRGTAHISDVLVLFAVGLRHLVRHGTRFATELGDDVLADDASFVAAVSERIAATDIERAGITPVTPDARWAPLLRLLDRTSEDLSAFDSLVLSWADRVGPRSGTTPPELAELMNRIAGDTRLLDPFCNVGELLGHAVRAGTGEPAVAGQYPDERTAHLATVSLWIRSDAVPRIAVGDALRVDAFAGETFRSVLCVPPWGVKDWGFEDLQFDPRWEYGLPPRAASELAWVQHALAHLDEQGTAVLALPVGVGTQARGRRIRAELVRRGVLRAVIALPAGAFSATSILTVLWVLRAPPADLVASSGVLMVDGSDLRARRGPDWRTLSDVALTAWREFDADEACTNRPDLCRVVPSIDLLDDEVNLNPARHLASAIETDVEGIRATRDRFTTVLRQLPDLVPDAVPQTEQAGASTSVDELARLGALTVLQQPGSTTREEQEGAFPALMPRDVLDGEPPSGWWRGTGRKDPIWVQPGDVVLPMLGGKLTSRVISDEKAVLSPNLWLLRPNQDQLDPWFVAGFLRNSVNATLSSGSMTSRLDVRRVELPRIPLAEQRAYAAAFDRLFQLERGLRQVQQDGQALITAMIDGLTSNGLQPPE